MKSYKELQEVRDFWNSESCGEGYMEGNTDIEMYTSETKNRYKNDL